MLYRWVTRPLARAGLCDAGHVRRHRHVHGDRRRPGAQPRPAARSSCSASRSSSRPCTSSTAWPSWSAAGRPLFLGRRPAGPRRPRPPGAGWLRRLLRAGSPEFWKEAGYASLLLPLGVVSAASPCPLVGWPWPGCCCRPTSTRLPGDEAITWLHWDERARGRRRLRCRAGLRAARAAAHRWFALAHVALASRPALAHRERRAARPGVPAQGDPGPRRRRRGRRAPPDRARPARRRPAAPGRARHEPRPRQGQDGHRPRGRQGAGRPGAPGGQGLASPSCATSSAACTPPCSPTAGSTPRCPPLAARSPVPVRLDVDVRSGRAPPSRPSPTSSSARR